MNRKLLPTILLLFSLLATAAGTAQTSPIQATVDRTTIAPDETVTLTVVVVDDSAQQPRPLLPRLDGLAVVDLDIATDVNLDSAGQIHTRVTYTYLLQPRRAGALTIPPVSVTIDGQTYKTAPIAIQVTEGGGQPAPDTTEPPPGLVLPPAIDSGEVFVEARVEPSAPFVGQQVVYTVRLFQPRQAYRDFQYFPPEFTGFDPLDLPMRQYNVDTADRSYLVTELKTILFPHQPGDITITPGQVALAPDAASAPVALSPEAVTVRVQPLPGNPPPDFSGAVGQYSIKAWFDPPTVEVNRPATLYVAVTGTGNLRALPELNWPELADWTAYNSLTSLTTTTQNDTLTGRRMYERVMVPSRIGEFVLPPVSLVYFDPQTGHYETIRTDSLTIQVEPAVSGVPTSIAALPTATPLPAGVPAQPTADVGLSAWAELLGYLFGVVGTAARWLFIGLCGLLPLAAVVVVGGRWLWQNRHLWLTRIQTAFREALAEARRAETAPAPVDGPAEEPLAHPAQTIHPVLAGAMHRSADNYKAVILALNTYLSDLLETPVNGLTRRELALRLLRRGLEESLVSRVVACLEQSELARYGPLADDAGWDLMVEADDLLFELDRATGGQEEERSSS